mmetsp:Transcript_22770/g.40419  ORF Transcript_22770/g.40419 Transcript_22770/m.40419 type:complete len:87 (+) Transcript_22770:587-847(+)
MVDVDVDFFMTGAEDVTNPARDVVGDKGGGEEEEEEEGVALGEAEDDGDDVFFKDRTTASTVSTSTPPMGARLPRPVPLETILFMP